MAKAISVFTNRPLVSRSTLVTWIRRIVFYACLLMLWQVLASSGIWPGYRLQFSGWV